MVVAVATDLHRRAREPVECPDRPRHRVRHLAAVGSEPAADVGGGQLPGDLAGPPRDVVAVDGLRAKVGVAIVGGQ